MRGGRCRRRSRSRIRIRRNRRGGRRLRLHGAAGNGVCLQVKHDAVDM
jgi:hypothetical protein